VTARLLAEGRAPRRARWLGAPLTIALLLCAAGASAAAGGGWISRGYRALADSFASQQREVAAPPKRAAPIVRRAPTAQASDVPPSASVAVLPQAELPVGELERGVAAPPPKVEPLPRPHAARQESARPERSAPEASNLVMDAMRALRQEGRPDSAAKQLDEYLRRHPSGALAEEALALSVEAATERGDPRARDLAERYLARYPSGRFRRAAERARALFSK
jgi:hypothetical protein